MRAFSTAVDPDLNLEVKVVDIIVEDLVAITRNFVELITFMIYFCNRTDFSDELICCASLLHPLPSCW
jgi:hypothetical protein